MIAPATCKCPHYEPDLDTLREAEACESAYRESIGEEQWEAEQAWAAQRNDEPSPIDDCDPCCKHMRSGRGHPGEHMTWCIATDSCLEYWFNESEVR